MIWHVIWGAVAVASVCGLVATTSAANAETIATPTKIRLYYQKAGASGCPEVEMIHAAVADRMGYDPFADVAPILVLVAISLDPDVARRARISVIDGIGRNLGDREIVSRAPTCDELVSTLALVISVAIPAATARQLEARRAAEHEALAKAAWRPLSATVESAPAVASRRGPDATAWRRLEVGGRASVGAVPGVAPGLTLGFGVRRGSISGSLELITDFARTQQVGDGSVDASLYRGALIVCRHGGDFGLCAFAAGGALHAEGHGFNQDSTVTSPYVAVGGRITYELPLARGFVAVTHLDAECALDSVSLSVTGETMWKWVAPGAGLAWGLALGSTFP